MDPLHCCRPQSLTWSLIKGNVLQASDDFDPRGVFFIVGNTVLFIIQACELGLLEDIFFACSTFQVHIVESVISQMS